MKRLFFVLMTVVGLFASCEGPAGRDGLDGAETYWFVKVYTINTNDWRLINGVDRLGSYYEAKISIKELDKDLYEKGLVSCYMFQRTNNNVEVQTPLPFTLPYGKATGGNQEELWTETYSFEYSPGSITFYVYYSDFYTSNRPPSTSFRVVLNY